MEPTSKSYRAWGLLALLALLAILIWYYCINRPGDGNKPPATFTDPVKAPVAIAFLDANRFLNTQIAKATVTLVDPDSMVVTSNGLRFTTLEIEGGVMSLALKQNADYSAQNPYRFTIKVESPGYSTNWRNILVTSDEGQYVPIFMAKLEDPPAGMASFVGAKGLTAGVLKTGAVFDTPSSSSGIPAGTVRIEIPPGTEPLYCNRSNPNASFPKNLNYRISYASPRSLAASRTFTGGPLVTDAVGLAGNNVATPASPIYFESAGWMNLEMDADGDPVNGFTKPVTVTMPILDSLVNPLTSPRRFYQAGDTIPVWSFNDRGVWRQEGKATVEGPAGNLSAKMTVTHLSTWNLDCTQSPCSTELTINYTKTTAGNIDYYSELIRTNNGIFYGITGASDINSHTLTYHQTPPAGSFTIANTPDGADVTFVAYDNNAEPTNALATTGPFTINCGTQPTPSLTIPAATVHTVNLSFVYREIIGGIPTEHTICKNAVFFAQCNGCTSIASCTTPTNPYRFGGILQPNTTSEGVVTLKRTGSSFTSGAQTNHCIRLWYGKDISGTTTSQMVDFNIDFADRSAGIHPIPSSGTRLLEYTFDNTTPPGVYKIVLLPALGLPVLPNCTVL